MAAVKKISIAFYVLINSKQRETNETEVKSTIIKTVCHN